MKKIVFLASLSGVLLFGSCNSKKTEEQKKPAEKTEKKDFKMYEMSEMAALMEQMYVDNQRLKDRIKNGEVVGNFPDHFLKIHKAVMTDESENDAFFKEQAQKFIEAQKLIYEDPKNAKTHFNNGVDACIRCHEVKCGGPIPRIKKLYIN
ncbi:hypothetical protein [Flavobacterium cerinum]|uniref:Cytochrome c n=1 Tax=Flavobacterium cerinum TaxID=2502784 RepID=A0ABY5IME6_9FLAO|nr:hypothetical protein [Flavobacterium cerinum]UUC43992.1 hypothetical protein NOX80_10145 [Flavobacterium cerinum]